MSESLPTKLHNRRILLGITGGIAAYKTAELVRALCKAGAEVRVVMSEAAAEFVTPMTLQALSGNPVRQGLFDPEHEAAMGHIELARWADLVLVAPATADFMARLTAGVANDLLSTLCLATAAPIALAPAMNQQMWQAAATRQNVEQLRQRSVLLWGPAEGEQACGDVGPGRMLEPRVLLQACAEHFSNGPLAGVQVTVTAGPTREPIDPVRFISNHSSGKMGFAIAEAAAGMGAQVRLVAGPVALETPSGVERINVESAEQMLQAVQNGVGDIFIACAAVADYRPQAVAGEKVKKDAEELSLSLLRNPDILATVSAMESAPFTVGFAAETENLADNARSKLQRKQLDMIAANWVGERAEGAGFHADENALHLFWADGEQELPRCDKLELARQLLTIVADRYQKQD